jgi:hypothetical protein
MNVGEESIAGRTSVVFDLTVSRGNSHWGVAAGERTFKPAYEGAIWIDKETRRVLCVEMRATSIPPDVPLRKLEQKLEYGFVKINRECT